VKPQGDGTKPAEQPAAGTDPQKPGETAATEPKKPATHAATGTNEQSGSTT
jgi:hypothetical protein